MNEIQFCHNLKYCSGEMKELESGQGGWERDLYFCIAAGAVNGLNPGCTDLCLTRAETRLALVQHRRTTKQK